MKTQSTLGIQTHRSSTSLLRLLPEHRLRVVRHACLASHFVGALRFGEPVGAIGGALRTWLPCCLCCIRFARRLPAIAVLAACAAASGLCGQCPLRLFCMPLLTNSAAAVAVGSYICCCRLECCCCLACAAKCTAAAATACLLLYPWLPCCFCCGCNELSARGPCRLCSISAAPAAAASVRHCCRRLCSCSCGLCCLSAAAAIAVTVHLADVQVARQCIQLYAQTIARLQAQCSRDSAPANLQNSGKSISHEGYCTHQKFGTSLSAHPLAIL